MDKKGCVFYIGSAVLCHARSYCFVVWHALLRSICRYTGLVLTSEPSTTYQPLEGENLLVRCNVTQTPDTFVFWKKNDTRNPFEQNGTDLMIYDIRRGQSGDYVCYLLNTSYPDFNATNANVTLEVIKVDVRCKFYYNFT